MDPAANRKAEAEQGVFRAFLRTQPADVRSLCWTYQGLASPIDFVSKEGGIGVELTEWLGEAQSLWVEERDRFREELLETIHARGPAAFRRGGKGLTAIISVMSGAPARKRKLAVITELLAFLGSQAMLHQTELRMGDVVEVPLVAFPPQLKLYFNGISLLYFPTLNLGIVVQKRATISATKGRAVSPSVALTSFRNGLKAKAITRGERYLREKRRLGLKWLWLVIHYSSPDKFIEPMRELGLQVGYGDHRRETQLKVAAALESSAREIGSGPFDHVYFLVDCQPDPFCSEIFHV